MSQAHATASSSVPQGAGDALLDELRPPPGAHALVIGHHTLETLCGLIRCGCAGATELRPDEQGAPRPELVQVALLPDPATPGEAATSVAIARRALDGGGRIGIRDASGRNRRALVGLLRAQGFVEISTRYTPEGALVLGKRPIAASRA